LQVLRIGDGRCGQAGTPSHVQVQSVALHRMRKEGSWPSGANLMRHGNQWIVRSAPVKESGHIARTRWPTLTGTTKGLLLCHSTVNRFEQLAHNQTNVERPLLLRSTSISNTLPSRACSASQAAHFHLFNSTRVRCIALYAEQFASISGACWHRSPVTPPCPHSSKLQTCLVPTDRSPDISGNQITPYFLRNQCRSGRAASSGARLRTRKDRATLSQRTFHGQAVGGR
jgi:hypothetical protein